MKHTMRICIPTVLLFFAGVAEAQVTDIFDAEALAYSLLSKLGVALMVLAVMLFFWGLVKFISNSSDTKEHEEGKKFIVWGLVALFTVFSVWALVGLILGEFGISARPIPYVTSR